MYRGLSLAMLRVPSSGASTNRRCVVAESATARPPAQSHGALGEVLPGFGLIAVLIALLVLAGVSWPRSPDARELSDQGDGAAAAVVPAAFRSSPGQFAVVIVVESEEQAAALRELRDRGSLVSGAAIISLPLEIEVSSLDHPADRQIWDDHLQAVCAATDCVKVLYLDLRGLVPH